ncbi:MAG TPA: hypothetical protein EYP14_13625, partial [Planctomycetaceae bacterium]|nr:hypothetical protein [Planctomycetaceae bacterium]
GCQSLSLRPLVRGQSPELPAEEPFGAGETSNDFRVDEPIADIVIEGNEVIETDRILQRIKTQIGRVATEQQIREDLKRLYNTHWFFSVEPIYRRTEKGLVLVFRVVERPMVERVEYRGNKAFSTEKLEKLTELKPGDSLDISLNRRLARRIEEEYHKKGYPYAKVTLLKGGSRSDREVIFQIDEGQKLTVTKITFTGNKSRWAFDRLLATKLRTKKALPGGITLLGGKFDPATIPDDIESLKQYYHDLGYFDVKVEHRVTITEEKLNPFRRGEGNVTIEYLIEEGPRYKIGNVVFQGNHVFSDEELGQGMKLRSGEYFSSRALNLDVQRIKDLYDSRGRLFAVIDAVPRFLEEPGVVDLVYRIDEDRVYTIRRIKVHILGDNPHTKETVVLNRILTHPGDLASAKLIQRSKRRLEGVIFERGPGAGPRVQVSKVPEKEPPFAESVATRGQSEPLPLPEPPNPIFENNPYGDPFARALSQPPGQIDLDYYVTEARTGRLMFGAGVNSDAGIVGSIILEENNFDLFRPPRSWDDILNGTAWRGAGQRFRLEAIPGDIVSRYLVSFSDPYFLNTDFSFGVSGFYFNRFYPDWDETRLGGRVSLGYQITNEWSVMASVRLESIELENPDAPTPQILLDAVGNNAFYSGRFSVAHDTRDAPFLPAEGHFLQASFEQAFGDYVYPRFEAEARQYFTVFSRPDGSGRHILSLGSRMGWSDVDTPIFERFFAGGFQSFRGFEFRGVGPVPNTPVGTDVRVGGRWLLTGSVQYLLPVTADEVVSVVFFSDFGTVAERVSFNDFRVSVGAGLRLTIPAMGPAPIALDWAFPVAKADSDDEQVFSFYVGLFR